MSVAGTTIDKEMIPWSHFPPATESQDTGGAFATEDMLLISPLISPCLRTNRLARDRNWRPLALMCVVIYALLLGVRIGCQWQSTYSVTILLASRRPNQSRQPSIPNWGRGLCERSTLEARAQTSLERQRRRIYLHETSEGS